MTTLLMQLVAPMQSWGVQSHFGHRDTGLEPSKSGVIGLACAALGRDRAEPIDDLAALRMGVRVDREGMLKTDFHTAQDVLKSDGGRKDTELSRRYYLSDAAFLVGLEGDAAVLRTVHAALLNPRWMLFLGRKAFVPSRPIGLVNGLSDDDLWNALRRRPALYANGLREMRFVIEDEKGESVRPDQPVTFAHGARSFRSRRVRTLFSAIGEDERARS
jgi:CRISPR system Cascade subunit CasD